MTAAEPILAVDDSAPIREMIVSILGGRGYRVVTAENGHEALHRLRDASEPHIILLDIVMPLLDGPAVCREIDRDEVLRNAGHRVILMSSSGRLQAPDTPRTAGQLVKPFSRQQLLEAVASLLSATA